MTLFMVMAATTVFTVIWEQMNCMAAMAMIPSTPAAQARPITAKPRPIPSMAMLETIISPELTASTISMAAPVTMC